MGSLRIIIVGAGIGGLTAALALRRAGFDPLVCEQTSKILPVGAGIQISPNAARLLIGLGLGDALSRVCLIPTALETKDWRSGRTIFSIPMGPRSIDAYGAPYWHVHRADLHAILLHAVGSEGIRLGVRCTDFTQEENGVRVDVDGGGSVHGDVLIGADGIHSVVRTIAFGPERPRFSGNMAFRGLIPAAKAHALGIERKATVWWGPGKHVVHYFVSSGEQLNFVAVVPASTWREESWLIEGTRDEVVADLKGWHPTVQALIGGLDRVHKQALYDRDPLARWSQGRVTLLGDAAHAMLPFQAQGAAQAIEDALVLTRCLSKNAADPKAALLDYERIRLPRTSRVQEVSRRNEKLFHLRPGALALARDTAFRAVARFRPQALTGAMDWLFEHDALAESANKPRTDRR